MAEDFEPVDVSKRKYIETVMEPDLDTAIIQLAQTRKKTPLRCVKEARKVANNNIYYCGKVCVVTEPEAEPVNLSGREVDKVCEISGMSEVCASLETLSKSITAGSAERQELLKAMRFLNHERASLCDTDHNLRKRPLISPNVVSNDFIVDEDE